MARASVFGYLGGMKGSTESLQELKRLWTVGLMIVILVGAAVVSGAILVGLPIFILGELLGISWETLEPWLLLSAAIWLPLFVGKMAPHLAEIPAKHRSHSN